MDKHEKEFMDELRRQYEEKESKCHVDNTDEICYKAIGKGDSNELVREIARLNGAVVSLKGSIEGLMKEIESLRESIKLI